MLTTNFYVSALASFIFYLSLHIDCCREAADEAVSGAGKLELLVAASQQIAAGTAQLVVASRVKADRDSKNLQAVSQASRGVSQATGAVVATAKACTNMVETGECHPASAVKQTGRFYYNQCG